MSPLPDEQPLSRRQLREQQRTTDATPEPQPRRASTSSAVPGGEIPELNNADAEARIEPALTTDQVTVLEEAAAAGKPLTRRQARDLERVRTASIAVIPPLVEPADPSEKKPDTTDADEADAETVTPAEITPAEPQSADKNQRLQNNGAVPTPVSSRMPAFLPASASPALIDDETAGDEVGPAAPKRTSFGLPVEDDSDLSVFTPESVDHVEDEPQLSSSFGEAVLDPTAPQRDQLHTELEQPFDQIIARGLQEAGNGVGTSSLILPSMPAGDPFTGPLSAQGGVVVTGSIDIPSGNGSNGSHPNSFDKSDIDAMFDEEDESRPATAGTPVSASRAVSTHTATRDVITPPAPARSNRLLLILAITAGVLAVAVLSVIVVGIAAGAFQSR